MQHSKEILLVTGEASGDVLGAELIPALKQSQPSFKLVAMGGDKMSATGIEMLVDPRQLAVIGLWDLIKNLATIRKAFTVIKNYLKKHKPTLVILIDYSGFNLRIAKVAHQLGIKVLFYVSPQIWASRYYRIHSIKKYVNHIIVFFKFEQEIYQREGIPVSLVAHPLLKITQLSLDKGVLYQELGLDSTRPIIALLPGSRFQEITKLLPLMNEAKKLIQQSIPNAQFVLPLAPSLKLSDLQNYLEKDTKVATRRAYEVLALSQAAIVTSGTATLETALMKTPLVIVYKVWGYHFARKWIIKTPYIGLCNIAAQQLVAKEYIQNDAQAHLVAEEIIALMQDTAYRQEVLNKLKEVTNQLGTEEASAVITRLVEELIAA